MMTYIYDASFDGLLTCIYEAFYSDVKPSEIIRQEDFIPSFLGENKEIKTDREKAEKVYRAIEEKISASCLKRVFYAYLSELPQAGIAILKYLELGFKMGGDVDLNLANSHVLTIDNIVKKLGKERHRLTGLLRFKKLDNDILYGQLEPDFNVIALLAPHFQKRLGNEKFIIHDLKRGIAVFYNKEEWIVRDIEAWEGFLVKDSEEIYEDLWRTYFKSISIQSKKNSKLQKRNMPMKYWKYLTEKG